MFKRVLKILGISLAIFIGICGAGFGIYALQGGFKEIEINILYLYMDDKSKAEKTIYTLEDFTTCINCEPYDATNLDLEVDIQDAMRITKDGTLIQEGILKNMPTTVKAGEEFKIEINKDARGNNYGGVVTLTFKPKNAEKNITYFTLKVVVDVAIPDKSLYFAGNNSDTYSTVNGKTITMGISNEPQDVYLKSNLVNAFCLETENKNLKSAKIGYTYITLDGKKCYDASTGKFIEKTVGTWTTADATVNTFEGLTCGGGYNKEEEKQYNYYYKIPITPSESGTIVMTAQMHRTYEIEQAYIAGGFDTFEDPKNNPSAQAKIDAYNEFLNKYMAYFDTSQESYEFFSNPAYMKNGIVTLPNNKAIEQSKKFIFQTASATINVSAVNLSNIESTSEARTFEVLSSKDYTVQNMIDEFDLDIKLSKDNVAHIDTEKANLFAKLQVSPYIYLSKDEYLDTKDTLWQNYGIVHGVTDFSSRGKPVVSDEVITTDNVENDEWLGFLILLSPKNSYDEYITIVSGNDSQNPVWTLKFNIPLLESNTETPIKSTKKALFLEFQVEGQNLETNEKIIKSDYTRVYIKYTEYDYKNTESAKIQFSNELKNMSITNKVSNASSGNYASELDEQTVSISLADSITNYDKVQYKNVMYFVEKNSNKIEDGGSKLATLGSYKFRYLNDGIDGKYMVPYFDTEEDLVGERLIGTISDTEYKLYALNASNEPARIFAVVYLSDASGNPIDVNGRPITINESTLGGEETTLVVFAITDTTREGMAKVQIDNFVDNLNYYTISKIGYSINEDIYDGENLKGTVSYSVEEGDWVKRNKIESYSVWAGDEKLSFGEEKLEELQNFLKLKILYNNQISLYVTNFDLTSDGTISENDTVHATTAPFTFEPFSKNSLNKNDVASQPIVISYDINTLQNKQLALNKMVENFSSYTLNIITTNTPAVQKTEIIKSESGAVLAIRFDIIAEGKMNATDDFIYLKANDNVPNALGNTSDYVGWEVNKLEIEDVELYGNNAIDYLNTYNKLYANYSDDATGGQVFGKVENGASGFQFSSYYLYEKNVGVDKNSIDDNVLFVVRTNLFSNGEINLSLVDMSQAIYDGDGSDQTDGNTSAFACIYDYIDYYTKNSQTIGIDYGNADEMAQLLEDLYFPSEDNYIYIGSKKYEIQTGTLQLNGESYTRYIVAGGRYYGVSTCKEAEDSYFGEEVVCIKKGEYFPIIKNAGDYKVIICDEEFDIENNDNVVEENAGIIYNISSSASTKRRSVKIRKNTIINGETYDVKDYIDEGIKDNTKTALEKTTDVTDNKKVTKATVKFIKGGVLKDNNGQDIYVKDTNGKYYYNSATKTYEICSDSTPANLRYSKKGIMAYLLITYNFTQLTSGNTTITKVIAYELVQEPVILVATGLVGNSNNTVVLGSQSDNTSRITINSGASTTFGLENISSSSTKLYRNTISIVGASYEKSFFKHCTFTIDGGNSGIKFVQNGTLKDEITISSVDEDIEIKVPDRYSSTDANIIISYVDDSGKTVQKYLRLTLKPNYTFESKNGVEGLDYIDNKYVISLDSESNYSIADLMAQYFNISDNCSIKLTNVDTANQYASISGDTLSIGKSYGYVDSRIIKKDEVEFVITLVDNATHKEVKIDNHLRVQITPKYLIDLSKISGDIVYGTNVISPNYITIYQGATIDSSNIVNASNFDAVINEIGLKLYDVNGNDLSGKIISSNKYATLSSISFTIKYSEGLTAEETFIKSINVIGFETYYLETGIADDITSYENVKTVATALPNTLEETYLVEADKSLNITRYFRVFTKANVVNKNIYVVLVQNGTVIGPSAQNDYGEFYLGYALLQGDSYHLLAVDNNIKITIKKLELFYSNTGSMSTLDYNTLKGDSGYSLANDVTFTINSDTFDYSKYFKIYADGVEISVVLKDSNNQTIGNEETTTEEGKTYDICCTYLSKTYDTGYNVTIKK